MHPGGRGPGLALGRGAGLRWRTMHAHRRLLLSLPLAMALPVAHAQADPTLTIAAASDLRFALDELVQRFRTARAGAQVDVVYGSSGKLSTQVRNGAPFDIFFSADRVYAEALQAAGLAAGPPQMYAIGRLVAWSADATLGRLTLDELVRHPAVKRFAIANPEHAPYGQRALEVLRRRGLYDAVRHKLVLGDNVSQAAQFVQTGAAQAGIVAYSLVLSPGLAEQGAWTLLPDAWHSPLEQAFVVTKRAAASPLAAAFVQHLALPASQALLQRHGFSVAARP